MGDLKKLPYNTRSVLSSSKVENINTNLADDSNAAHGRKLVSLKSLDLDEILDTGKASRQVNGSDILKSKNNEPKEHRELGDRKHIIPSSIPASSKQIEINRRRKLNNNVAAPAINAPAKPIVSNRKPTIIKPGITKPIVTKPVIAKPISSELIEEKDKLLSEKSKEIDELNASLHLEQGRLGELQSEFEELKSKYSFEQNQSALYKAEIENMKHELGTLLSQINDYEKETANFREVQSSFDVKLKELSEKNVSLEEQLNNATERLKDEKLRLEVRIQEAKNLAVNEYLLKIQEETSKVKEEMDAQLASLHQEKYQLEKKFSAEIEQLKSQLLEKQFKIRELELEHSTEIKQIEFQHKIDFNNLQSELATLRSENLNLLDSTQKEKSVIAEEYTAKFEKLRDISDKYADALVDINRKEKVIKELENTISEQNSALLKYEVQAKTSLSRMTENEQMAFQRTQELESLRETKINLEKKVVDLKERLMSEENIRRKLHNTIQELKGNIRVFCRVRPLISSESDREKVEFHYPDLNEDAKEIEINDAKAVETTTNGLRAPKFSFDRVFDSESTNKQIFDEVSQLIQSALDGYRVCIFAYGQTGSGKTFTMCSEDGMIPKAIHQIYQAAENLLEKGWSYSMTGQFLEIYNEGISDLISGEDDYNSTKHDIIHENGRTRITNMTTVSLDSPESVDSMLFKARQNRTVAATKANERSSRSHFVFILNIQGYNSKTKESIEGVLNLIDLAGSERLSQSQVKGERLKETISINKSLSALGDVIAALGLPSRDHVPYRNSKLTYLLQNSLSKNSKTLMFVNISPLKANLNETICSLRFAAKVNSTVIGTAKKLNVK